MFDLIKKLTGTFGVSGNEEAIRNAIIEEIKAYVDDIKIDTMGNLIAVKKANPERGNGKKIMLAAHMDEIGLIATYIDYNVFISFSGIGGVSPYISLGQRVQFANGIIGAIHYEQKLESMKDLSLSKMYIDIGAKSREEALSMVSVGDVACFSREAILQGDIISSKALDDRCGCAVLIETLKRLDSSNNELYFVFTVQEEIGQRGAKTAAFGIMPDICIAIDVTRTGDTPESKLMEVALGKGPAIKIMDRSVICHPFVKRLLDENAKKAGISCQYEVLEQGGSDPGAIHITGGGIPSGAVSIPCRYLHSPVETISLSDAENAVRLLVSTLSNYQ